MSKRLTIRDISRLTGYSRSTVSLVLNNSPKVSPDTRERILSVIREVDYHPSMQARGLAARKSRTVSVVVPPIREHLFSDYYYSEALGGISEVAAESDYDLLLEIATPRFFSERKHWSLFKTGAVSGMLFVGASEEDAYITELQEGGYFIMLVNSRNGNAPCIVADNRTGAYEGVKRLLDMGHTRIAHIAAPTHLTTGADRVAGYEAAMSEAGIYMNGLYRRRGNWTEEDGYREGLSLLRQNPRPTAIFAANDMMAVGVLRAAAELGLSVPEQLSVLGADDIVLASFTNPPLCTIRQPIYEIARIAMLSILSAVETHQPPESKVVPTEFVARGSCAPPPAD